MKQPKKLIEVALPIKEISAESVRDKSIRHGHISTLHLWWARRPLPVCRAVLFASLVPDPLDEHCPKAFADAVKLLLARDADSKLDPYKPYADIPYTTAIDPMEDNARNRLLMFIGKFSDTYIQKGGKVPAKDQLHDGSLIKWDNKKDEKILNIARKLIWVAYNSQTGSDAVTLMREFDRAYRAIREAEHALYSTTNRHLGEESTNTKEKALEKAIEGFLARMPSVFDPFAGGGAIPLEAARLGCRSFGNDLNPVAHIIQKGSLEFPQKYGKPIQYSLGEFTKKYGKDALNNVTDIDRVMDKGEMTGVKIANRLSFDVAFYARKLIKMAEGEVGHFYPADMKGNKPIAYYWARVGTCSNPSCRAEVPLLKGFYLVNKPDKKVHLRPVIVGNQIAFEVKKGSYDGDGWMNRGNMICPCCGNTTDVKSLKQQFIGGKTSEKLLAVIWDGDRSKEYQKPTQKEIDVLHEIPENIDKPGEIMPVQYTQALPSCTWGLSKWGDMFSRRQLLTLNTLVVKLHELKKELIDDQKMEQEKEYNRAVLTYLGILVDRVAVVNTSFGRWHVSGEKLEHPFARQAIPMIFDYPESNPFCKSTGSASNQLDWLTRYIESESSNPFAGSCHNASSGEKSQFAEKSLTAVVTDPPYYDAIAYADLSDFFYVWLKRTLGELYPLNFATPQTPKSEECTALKHHHGAKDKANQHFEHKLLQIFDAIEHQTRDIVSIMFAHQSTEAWTTLCNSILGARMNITGSWAIDTELANRSLGLAGAVLDSSVTVACKPAQRKGTGEYREVKVAIDRTVKKEVGELYRLGFRGADLLTACFGPAVSEFGKYRVVEKADGSDVTVAELLEMAREAAFNAIVSDIDTDDYTKFYLGWLNLFGFTDAAHDDVRRISQIGLNIDLKELVNSNILIQDGKKQALATYGERVKGSKKLGEGAGSYMIDQLHRAMYLYQGANRNTLVQYIGEHASQVENPFWRVLTSLSEVLPAGMEDHTSAIGLITSKESLIRESQALSAQTTAQTKLFE